MYMVPIKEYANRSTNKFPPVLKRGIYVQDRKAVLDKDAFNDMIRTGTYQLFKIRKFDGRTQPG
jgi:hypothetical protein